MVAKIETASSCSEIIEGNIFLLQYKPGSTSKLKDLQDAYQSFLKLGKNQPIKALIEIGKNAYFDVELNECIKQGKVQPLAEAIVSDSLAIRLVIDYYIHSRRNDLNHIRLFKNRTLALEWLNSL